MNFIIRLSINVKKNKINVDNHILKYALLKNSKNLIKTLDGSYKITDEINNEKKFINNLKKIEMHESHSCKPFIRN